MEAVYPAELPPLSPDMVEIVGVFVTVAVNRLTPPPGAGKSRIINIVKVLLKGWTLLPTFTKPCCEVVAETKIRALCVPCSAGGRFTMFK